MSPLQRVGVIESHFNSPSEDYLSDSAKIVLLECIRKCESETKEEIENLKKKLHSIDEDQFRQLYDAISHRMYERLIAIKKEMTKGRCIMFSSQQQEEIHRTIDPMVNSLHSELTQILDLKKSINKTAKL